MEMFKYPKIQSVYKRDPDNNFKTFLEGEYSEPEFEFLQNSPWVATEKIDGTNIRVMYDGEKVDIRGRTDRAQIPPFLLERLREIFTPESMANYKDMIFFGEGYGNKIQKVGEKYNPDGVDFILFDIFAGVWLERANLEAIAESMGIDIVPVIDIMTLPEAVEFARNGFFSRVAEGVSAEGLVLKPALDLITRTGERIITKVKTKDFQ